MKKPKVDPRQSIRDYGAAMRAKPHRGAADAVPECLLDGWRSEMSGASPRRRA
jgi:hypothetical protein